MRKILISWAERTRLHRISVNQIINKFYLKTLERQKQQIICSQ